MVVEALRHERIEAGALASPHLDGQRCGLSRGTRVVAELLAAAIEVHAEVEFQVGGDPTRFDVPVVVVVLVRLLAVEERVAPDAEDPEVPAVSRSARRRHRRPGSWRRVRHVQPAGQRRVGHEPHHALRDHSPDELATLRLHVTLLGKRDERVLARAKRTKSDERDRHFRPAGRGRLARCQDVHHRERAVADEVQPRQLRAQVVHVTTARLAIEKDARKILLEGIHGHWVLPAQAGRTKDDREKASDDWANGKHAVPWLGLVTAPALRIQTPEVSKREFDTGSPHTVAVGASHAHSGATLTTPSTPGMMLIPPPTCPGCAVGLETWPRG